MALFQPTNVIPSSFTVGVVDAANDTAQVSWQVNGNSAMIAFEIEFCQNDTNSTVITRTGRQDIAGGFYGTDRFGQPKMYTWTAVGNRTWSAYNSKFTNGNQYKFKIKQYWKEGGAEKSIEQIESNVFITRDTPNFSVQRSGNADFTEPVAFPQGSTLPASIGYFVGVYSQAQGAPVREARWQVATWLNGAVGEILADTGDVDTPTLQYSFNGFFLGNEYAVRCTGKADYQTYGTQDFDSGWWNFTAKLSAEQTQSTYNGNFSVQCLPKENAALLQWEAVEVIPPTVKPDGYEPTFSNGTVILPATNSGVEYSVTWDKKSAENSAKFELVPINFAAPWTAAFKIKPLKTNHTESKSVSGQATEVLSVEKISTTTIGSSIVESTGNGFTAHFFVSPDSPYAEVSRVRNVVILRNATLTSFTTSKTPDYTGRMRVDIAFTAWRYGTSPTVQFAYTCRGYAYDETVTTGYDIVRYSVQSRQPYEITQNGERSLSIRLWATADDIPYGRFDVSAELSIETQEFKTQGTMLTVGGSDINVKLENKNVRAYLGSQLLGGALVNSTIDTIVVILAPSTMRVVSFRGGSISSSRDIPITYSQGPITSLKISGGTGGVNVDSIAVFQDEGENVLSRYNVLDFEPLWNSPEYTLYMAANFANNSLEGGTGTASGDGFRIYRQEVGSNILTPIANVESTIVSLKDYGIRSRKSYKYSLYAYDSGQAFMASVENDTVVSTCFKNYSLLVCDYDSEKDAYHVRKQYLFALNLSAGSIGNNNTPTLNANFTAYPTRMPSTQNYTSGTLQGLIGAIYTVPALIEQIGGFKYTARPSTLDYFDSVDLEKELYDLSVAPYQLFLRDMKGHLRMVATSGAISMTQDLKKRQLSTTISLPWVEIGDASDVTIIQTPDDYGWNFDGQVLDVHLDVDPETGILTATYPKPYNGTKFYLTGANKEILGAKTPLGVTPAQFELSAEAKEPDDGTLTATATVNTEEGD